MLARLAAFGWRMFGRGNALQSGLVAGAFRHRRRVLSPRGCRFLAGPARVSAIGPGSKFGRQNPVDGELELSRRGRQTWRSAAIGGTPVTTGRRRRRGRGGHLHESVGGRCRPVGARGLLLLVDVLRHRARTRRSPDARTTHRARHGRRLRTSFAAYTGVAPQRPRTLRDPRQPHAAPLPTRPLLRAVPPTMEVGQ